MMGFTQAVHRLCRIAGDGLNVWDIERLFVADFDADWQSEIYGEPLLCLMDHSPAGLSASDDVRFMSNR